jgi:3-oxoacyl-[acyl-carrier-protein] synthase-3
MVDTTDEWIMTRIGIKERRILKEEGVGSSFLGAEAVKNLLEKTNTSADEIDLLICATVTPDMQFPANANIISDILGIKNAFSYDINAGCSGFIFTLDAARRYVESGQFKKVVVVGCEKMSSIVDYTDRTTCPIFGDGAAAVMLEPTTEDIGIIDSILKVDGSGRKYLNMKSGGSAYPASEETVKNREHFIFQDGKPVFKAAVSSMADTTLDLMARNNMTADDITWLVPHQANMRIIEAVAKRMELAKEKVMINIQDFGNTTSATIPLCLSQWESKLKKGDNIILSAFGAGFTWGTIYLKWGYDGK